MPQKTGCLVLDEITDPDMQNSCWEVYCQAFTDAATTCIQEQRCYDETNFKTALADRDYKKFVAIDNDVPVGLGLCTADLEKARIAYVNPSRLLRDYPEYVGRIYYFTAIVIRPSHQKNNLVLSLIDEMTRMTDEKDAIVAFDFSTEKNPTLPALLLRGALSAQKRLNLRTNTATYYPLGGQEYGIIKIGRR